MAEVEYRLLGPVALLRGGEPLPVGGNRTLTLLAGLLLSANQTVTGERLAEIVWGERQPARPRSALHSAISRLRRAVGGGVIDGVPAGYRLNVGADALDLLRSDRLVDEAEQAVRRGMPDAAAAALGEALALWQGCPLGNVDSVALNAEAVRLAEKHLVLHEEHADLCLRLGRHAAVLELLPTLVRAQPFRERLVGQLMLALFRSGRQAEALAAYEALNTALHEELGIFPSGWLRDLHVRILRADLELERQHPAMQEQQGTDALESVTVAGSSREAVSANVRPREAAASDGEARWRGLRPAAQDLIGRERDIEELCSAVRAQRVVTLVGAAGVGKTSVALKTAERLVARFRDGVVVAELGTVAAAGNGDGEGDGQPSDSEADAAVAETVRCALGAQTAPGSGGEEAVIASLRRMELLLVLDNAEHVADATGRFVDCIVRSCPEVTVLTTSRRPLGVGAETVAEVRTLEPAPAVGLLRLRMSGHRPRLDPDADPEGLADLCRLVDGLPLAIELAALRLRTMPLRALLRRIGRQRGLLAGPNGARLPHQRSLDSSLRWSYDLLTRPGRLLLHRLALFEGCFSLEQAERACARDAPAGRQATAGLLGGLVEHCMVQAVGGADGYSYRLLRPMRDFVLDIPVIERPSGRDRHQAPHGVRFGSRARQCTVKVSTEL